MTNVTTLTDPYLTALGILHELLKKSGNQPWAEWIQKDIELWTQKQDVVHHLDAFRGMGSLWDLSLVADDAVGVWEANLFATTRKLSFDLAKKKIQRPPLNQKYYEQDSLELNGWQCTDCALTKTNWHAIETYLAARSLPSIFVDLLHQDKLIDLLDMEKFANSPQTIRARETIEHLLLQHNVNLITGDAQPRVCSKCGGRNLSVCGWQSQRRDTALTMTRGTSGIRKAWAPLHFGVLPKALRAFVFLG
jgi:hypothetical protein